MDSIYSDYYKKQAGSGLSNGYKGARYSQAGNGFLGKILKNLKPALHYLTNQGLNALKMMSREVISGESLANAGKNTLLATTQNVLADAQEKLKNYKKQTGKGYKRKRTTKRRVKRKKTTKKTKQKKRLYKAKTKRKNKTKKKVSIF